MTVLVIIILLVLAYVVLGIANVSLVTAAFCSACSTRDARVAWRRGLISIADHKQLAATLVALREGEPALSLDEAFDVLAIGMMGYCLIAWPTFLKGLPDIIAIIRAK